MSACPTPRRWPARCAPLLAWAVLLGSCERPPQSADRAAPAVAEQAVADQAVPAQAVPEQAAIEPADPEQAAPPPAATALRVVPAGPYRPMFPGKGGEQAVSVPAFALEEHAVTNAQFLAFVRVEPRWRRSRVVALFADAGYLMRWRGDLDLGDAVADSPVTHVSWFAARAYARWLGRRLPTLNEWESVAGASEHSADGRDEPGFAARILAWYSKPAPRHPAGVRSTSQNVHGVWDMHGLVWEWVDDFNSALVTGESRGDAALERNLFCGSGSLGAADPSDYAAFMRFAFRSSLAGRYVGAGLGFRCAKDLEPTEPR